MADVLTKAAIALKQSRDVEHVKFESHKAKPKTEEKVLKSRVVHKPSSSKDVDLKKIRHEIVKFGMSGFDAPKKEEARVALLVSLGAKPPRKKYVNYKELISQRKEEKQKEKERKEMLGRDMLRVSKPAGKKKKNINDVGHMLNVYGKVDKKKIKDMEDKSNNRKKRK